MVILPLRKKRIWHERRSENCTTDPAGLAMSLFGNNISLTSLITHNTDGTSTVDTYDQYFGEHLSSENFDGRYLRASTR